MDRNQSTSRAERDFWDRLIRESGKARRLNARISSRQQLRTRSGKQIPRRSKVS